MFNTSIRHQARAGGILLLAVAFSSAAVAQDEPAPATDAAGGNEAMIIDLREDLSSRAAPRSQVESSLVQEYLAAIAEAESDAGAYAPGITEQLLGLGAALQQLGRHEEAIDAFKRGVHLTRINSGLYSSEQIALLRGQIRSHLALGDFAAVDERQRYLYRVERQSLANSKESGFALLKQAEWQRDAYLVGLGDDDAQRGRLLLMWDLYRMSLSEMLASHGKNSPELREPLMGMLQAQYLFSGYKSYNKISAATSAEARYAALTSESYKRGESVFKALLELDKATEASPEQQVNDMVLRGDWAWWFGKRGLAKEFYWSAQELAQSAPDPEALVAKLFGSPVPIPGLEGINTLPAPILGDQGELVLSFNVSSTGRLTDFERLREPDVEDSKDFNRLIRTVKNTRFRPRFENGIAVDSENIVWSWNAEAWESPMLAVTAQR